MSKGIRAVLLLATVTFGMPGAMRAEQSAVTSGVDVSLYGFVKLDAAYDTGRVGDGNFVNWAVSDETNRNDNEFNMTAKQTRLGMNLSGPSDSSGKVEIDFYHPGATTTGAAVPENKAAPMMRHAYMKVELPDSGITLLAGQTSDVISPLVPSTLNYTVGWWAGDIGYRRPQIRLTKGLELSDVDCQLQVALTRTIGGGALGGTTPGDAGEDAGFPTFQARTSFALPMATLGISGHWGQEEKDTNAAGAHVSVDTWSINLDLVLPVNDTLTIKGEAFTGANLGKYLGGVGQSTNGAREIQSTGGWLAASIGPFGSWRLNVGATIDDPDNDDLADDGDKVTNSSIFGNAVYSFNSQASVGLELSRWDTDYKGDADADVFRTQLSFIYKF